MKDKTAPFTCQGGPLANKTLRLSIDHPYTFTFNLKGWKGRYANNRTNTPILYWEDA